MDTFWDLVDCVWPDKPVLKIKPGVINCRTCAGSISSNMKTDHNPTWSWFRNDKYPNFDKLAAGCKFCHFVQNCLNESLLGERYRDERICLLPRGQRRCRVYGVFHIEPNQWGPYLRDQSGKVPLNGSLELGFKLKKRTSSGWRSGKTVRVDFALSGLPKREDYILSKRNIDWMNECLSNCDAQHANCRYDSHNFTPTRLVDISDYDSDRVTILECHRLIRWDEHESLKYAALSYRWGAAPPEAQEYYYLLQDLPAVINDAVKVARALGLQYLWVDALCIQQDDEEEEKAREIKRMGDVYSNAYVTIISTDRDLRIGNQGFLFRESPDCVVELPCQIVFGRVRLRKFTDKMTAMLAVTPQSAARVERTDWSERGWTLQEEYLSSRRLFFSSGTVYFECQQSQHLEHNRFKMPRKLPPPLFRASGPFLHEAYNSWYWLVERYSTRELSDPKDRLAAIEGLAKRVEKITKDSYIAGIFRKDAARGLLWRKFDPSHSDTFHWKQYMPPKTRFWLRALFKVMGVIIDNSTLDNVSGDDAVFTAPTWSWSSVTGKIKSPDECKKLQSRIVVHSMHPYSKRTSNKCTDMSTLTLYGRLVLLQNSFKKHKIFLLYLRGDTQSKREGLVIHQENMKSIEGLPDRFSRVCYFSTTEEPDLTLWNKFQKAKKRSILFKNLDYPEYPGKEAWKVTEQQYWQQYLKAKDKKITLV